MQGECLGFFSIRRRRRKNYITVCFKVLEAIFSANKWEGNIFGIL